MLRQTESGPIWKRWCVFVWVQFVSPPGAGVYRSDGLLHSRSDPLQMFGSLGCEVGGGSMSPTAFSSVSQNGSPVCVDVEGGETSVISLAAVTGDWQSAAGQFQRQTATYGVRMLREASV